MTKGIVSLNDDYTITSTFKREVDNLPTEFDVLRYYAFIHEFGSDIYTTADIGMYYWLLVDKIDSK